MAEYAMNPAWLARRVKIGTVVKISEDAVIDAVRIDGKTISSPYRDGKGINEIVNSEEAKRYLGQVGTVIAQSFGHQVEVEMEDGATVIPLNRYSTTEVQS